MAFLNLFKPKWKHSDKDVRMNALKEIKDEKIISMMAHHEQMKTSVRRQ